MPGIHGYLHPIHSTSTMFVVYFVPRGKEAPVYYFRELVKGTTSLAARLVSFMSNPLFIQIPPLEFLRRRMRRGRGDVGCEERCPSSPVPPLGSLQTDQFALAAPPAVPERARGGPECDPG